MSIGRSPRTGKGRQSVAVAAHRFARRALCAATAASLILFAFNSLTRWRNFSPDGMNYVDVANHIAAGQGIAQATLGFNQPRLDIAATIPEPMTTQAPLYPVLIAALVRLGVPAADAALWIAAVAHALVVAAAYALGRRLYGETVALVAAVGLLFYAPLREVGAQAWSETTAIVLVLASLWLVAAPRGASMATAALAGLAGGLAFACRYAVWPAAVIAAIPLVARAVADVRGRRHDARRSLWALLLYALGVALPVGLVVWRNVLLVGRAGGPAPNPAALAPFSHIRGTVGAVCGRYLGVFEPVVELGLVLVFVAVCVIVLAARHRLRAALWATLVADRRYLLWGWAFGYLLVLILYASRFHIDPIGPRLVAPAGVALVVGAAALVAQAVPLASEPRRRLVSLLLVGALVAAGREAWLLVRTPPHDLQDEIARSGRLRWIAQATTDADLVIGEKTMDVPFYFGGRAAVSFSPYPFNDRPDYAQIRAYADRHCGEYRHVYLVLRRSYADDADWRHFLGPFVADLVAGRLERYPDVVPVQTFDDGYAFEIHCRTMERGPGRRQEGT
jgi:hypothetical protein